MGKYSSGLFLDVTKEFGRVRHNGLLHKLSIWAGCLEHLLYIRNEPLKDVCANTF